MTVPAFLENADAEDAAELAQLTGFDLNAAMSDAQLDAFASDICRHLANAKADLARYQEAEAAELQRITAFYETRCAPLDLRIRQLEAIGTEIAKRAHFPGKSKSRKVAFGCYGSRKIPEKITVVDEAKALDWLHQVGDDQAIRVKRSVDLTVAKPIVLARLRSVGEVPEGFEHVGESEVFFIKAEA